MHIGIHMCIRISCARLTKAVRELPPGPTRHPPLRAEDHTARWVQVDLHDLKPRLREGSRDPKWGPPTAQPQSWGNE